MAPIDHAADSVVRGGWPSPEIWYTFIGAVLIVSLIVVIIKCACCRRSNPQEPLSLLYDARDTDVPRPEEPFEPLGTKAVDLKEEVAEKDRLKMERASSNQELMLTARGSGTTIGKSPFSSAKIGQSRTAQPYQRRESKPRKRKCKKKGQKIKKDKPDAKAPNRYATFPLSLDSEKSKTPTHLPRYYDNQRYDRLSGMKEGVGQKEMPVKVPNTDANDEQNVIYSRRVEPPPIQKQSISCRVDLEDAISPASPVSQSVRNEDS